ncbi:hypothetical protein ABBQ38_003076 [Trebouxia sp. C0009 RCD-2024]
MAWTNFIITLVGVGSIAYLMKSDVRRGSGMLKQNLKTIRGWLEEEGSKAGKSGSEEIKKISEHSKVKPPKDV